MFISNAFQRPCRKIISLLNLTQIVHSNSKMLFLKQLIVYQSFYGALLAFSFFFSRKSSVFRTRRHVTFEMFIYISGSTWHKSFIQMVKYSFSDERIVYRSFLNINLSVSVSYAVDKLHVHTHAALCEEYVQHTCPPIPNRKQSGKQRDLDHLYANVKRQK